MKVSLRSCGASGDTLRPFNVGGLPPEAPKGRRVAEGVALQNNSLQCRTTASFRLTLGIAIGFLSQAYPLVSPQGYGFEFNNVGFRG